MNILVTGGLGFIGSHTVVSLLASDHDVYIVDDLSNAKMEVLDTLKQITGAAEIPFEKMDVTDAAAINRLFSENHFDGVIHFAGYKAVGESVSIPLAYYKNNVLSTIVLAETCLKHGVERFKYGACPKNNSDIHDYSADMQFEAAFLSC
ncbi:SDR family NAD(P)-dependent oxidoreductase [Tetzosporium hominis]|nr:SDR family NAD(P)-dependent oxidoreductase [Tetzosporium hominis]